MQKLKSNLKSYTLFAYVTLTLLGAYTAAIFYAGMQYEGTHRAEATSVHVVTSKAPAR